MISIDEKDFNYTCDLQAPCFQQLSQEAIHHIKDSKTFVLFRKGDQLCKQLRLIQPAEFIGLHAVFFSKIYDYSAVAITDCYAILVKKEALQKVMSDNADFTMQLMSRYIHQNTNLYRTIEKLQFNQMHGRFASVLLSINDIKKLYPDVFRLMSRKQLAEFAGISTESSIKLLKGLEKEGTITLDNKDIVIKNEEALKALSKLG